VLVGSGVSSGRRIPTGWTITLDLVASLRARERGRGIDLEAWYVERSTRLRTTRCCSTVGAKPAERQAIIRGYIEAHADERERGLKVPTEAHHAWPLSSRQAMSA